MSLGYYSIEDDPIPYSVRVPCEPDIEADPDALMSQIMDVSIETREHAVHPEGFFVSETSFVRGRDGLVYIVSGANFNPVSGVDPRRICALGVMFNEVVHVGDIFGGAVLIRSPEQMKRIVGCRDSKTLHSCGPCRPVVARIDPMTVMAGIRGDGRDVEEALTIGQKIDYHDFGGSYPRTPRGVSPARFFFEAVRFGLNAVISRDPSQLIQRTIDPADRT